MLSEFGLGKGTLTIDPTKSPKQIDFVPEFPQGRKTLGIYKVEGDRLTLCIAQPGKERPTEFACKGGAGHTLGKLKRVAKTVKEPERAFWLRRVPLQGQDALLRAIGAGDAEKVGKLLDQFPKLLEARDPALEETPLHEAASKGKAEVVKVLIKRGADVHARTVIAGPGKGWTPLHFAAVYGHVDAAKVLLDNGAKVNAKSDIGDTPLDIAVERGRKGFAEFLKEKGGVSGENSK